MGNIRSFKDRIVWQKAMDLDASEVLKMIKDDWGF